MLKIRGQRCTNQQARMLRAIAAGAQDQNALFRALGQPAGFTQTLDALIDRGWLTLHGDIGVRLTTEGREASRALPQGFGERCRAAGGRTP